MVFQTICGEALKVKKLSKILILGSGGLKIGQAGEFDYSGSQAIKAVKEEGLKTILINPNIATVQTDPGMADEVYLLPLDVYTVTEVIKKERPDGILLGFGGQTALNLGLALHSQGILEKYEVEILGTPIRTIEITEDRDLFKKSLAEIGVKTARSIAATTLEAALKAAIEIGYPVMLRAGFSLGGLGSGKARNEDELIALASDALAKAPQLLIEEDLSGWKEIEYEVVRDAYGNIITVCNMENFDPMGIHTGESIVVAPSQTLTNAEYHLLREVALRTISHLGVIGECNIQYALNPQNGEYRVIEVNARLSRSSALASKATGYPLAFVAAKCALGKRLDEIKNSVTKKTSAFFEPALDYIVVKMPRWDTQKLKSADRKIGSEMKSVGEVMAIGRTFAESLQKAVRMVNVGATSLFDYPYEIASPEKEIEEATDRRLFALAAFFREGGSVEKAHALSKIDLWFLHHLHHLILFEKELTQNLSRDLLIRAKKLGFSDVAIAKLQKSSANSVRDFRKREGILPVVKQIDTLAGEFDAETNYLYLTYHGKENDVVRCPNPPIIVLGSGPYAIGSSVEFDWCAVNGARSLRKKGKTVVMINCNPETVSTDYDESDHLYFEELTEERIQDIIDFESPAGVIVSFGGQVANNLALKLGKCGNHILGTSPQDIDLAEDRQKFSSLLSRLGIDQPHWLEVTSLESAKLFAKSVGYPLLVRPSYVLSGSAMSVVAGDNELETLCRDASIVSPEYPVVISKFILGAKELEIDGVAKNGEILIEAISEHIENAGVHSGDATVVLPPQKLYLETIRRAKSITREIVLALNITGPFNIQFIAEDNSLKVIECNVRASRSFPFVSKVTGHNFIEIAIQAMVGNIRPQNYNTLDLDFVGIKTPQFSYHRLKGSNPVAHVEMASTGEVACLGPDLLCAFLSSWLATEQQVHGKRLLLSVGGGQKEKFLEPIKLLEELGWEIMATPGTHEFLSKWEVPSGYLYKGSELKEPNVLTAIREKKVDLIINIPGGGSPKIVTDGYKIRRLAIDHNIPLITNVQTACVFLNCMRNLDRKSLPIKSLKEYHKSLRSNG